MLAENTFCLFSVAPCFLSNCKWINIFTSKDEQSIGASLIFCSKSDTRVCRSHQRDRCFSRLEVVPPTALRKNPPLHAYRACALPMTERPYRVFWKWASIVATTPKRSCRVNGTRGHQASTPVWGKQTAVTDTHAHTNLIREKKASGEQVRERLETRVLASLGRS